MNVLVYSFLPIRSPPDCHTERCGGNSRHRLWIGGSSTATRPVGAVSCPESQICNPGRNRPRGEQGVQKKKKKKKRKKRNTVTQNKTDLGEQGVQRKQTAKAKEHTNAIQNKRDLGEQELGRKQQQQRKEHTSERTRNKRMVERTSNWQ